MNKYTIDDISIYDTTHILTDKETENMKIELVNEMNEAFNFCKDC